MRVWRSLIATPMPPKRRPSPPSRSRKPRCNLAGTQAVTFIGFREAIICKRRLPRFFPNPGFSRPYSGLDCVIVVRLAIAVEARRSLMADQKERTYSDEEVQARLER